jgi:hypothetical protein
MTTLDTMHPFVALMRRYCIDYTNSHDQSIYPEIFVDDYTVNINGVALHRDTAYGPAVAQLFAAAPGLGLTVHELVLNGDRLCMRFSEHAALPTRAGGRRLAAWRGIGLYKWDGSRLTENYVEQDFFSRREQLAGAAAHAIDPPHLDPWMSTRPVPADPAAEAVVRELVSSGELHEARWAQIDASAGESVERLIVAPEEVVVNDLFSAGGRVAVHATVRGSYRGGLALLPDTTVGSEATLQVAAVVQVGADHSIEEVHAVSSRDVIYSALRPPR